MKPKYFYPLLVIVFIAFASVIVFTRKQEVQNFSFVERSGVISNSSEWANTKAAIQGLLNEIRNNPSNKKAKLNLVLAYIQESRVTGNHAYYDAAALQLVDQLLKEDENNFEALSAKATVLLSQHHFTDALVLGNKLIKMNPYSAYSYGIMTDANVELGNYIEAIKMADKMVACRPDIRSYARVSYLREIIGDNKGAMEAMQMAVESGVPGNETTEWSRVYLGKLYEQTGNLKEAEKQYQVSLIHRPYYAYALAGLGRIEKSRLNYSKAIEYFKKAQVSVSDYSFSEELAGIYRLMGNDKLASVELKNCIDDLAVVTGDETKSFHGHYADRELALVYIDAYRYDLALRHALIEYSRRPDNIDVNRTLAWVYFKRREYAKSEEHLQKALRMKTQNPSLLYEAGLIKAKSGNVNEGKQLLKEAIHINPYTSPDLRYLGNKYFNNEMVYASK